MNFRNLRFRHQVVMVLLLTTLSLTLSAQVAPGNVGLFTQTQVDNFNFTEVTGTITLNGGPIFNGGDPITNLNGLSELEKVGGDFQIASMDGTDLSGLANLESVGGNFRILTNPNLTNIDLPKLTTIGGLVIDGNPELTTVSMPLVNSSTIASNWVLVRNSPKLTNVDFLSFLVNANVLLELTQLGITNVNGLANLKTVGPQGLRLNFNPELTDISGIAGLTSSGGITIQGNAKLEDCCTLIPFFDGTTYGTVRTFGNRTDCNGETNIRDACMTTPTPLTLESGNRLLFMDPCSCTDPLNCDIGGVTYFHDSLVVTTGGVSGLNITTVAGATDFFTGVSCNGGTLTSVPAGTAIPEVPLGSGIYKLEFWRPSGSTPTISVMESGAVTAVPAATFQPVCTQAACVPPPPPADPIPTMSEWGLLIFGLLTLNLGVFFVRRKEMVL